MDQVPARRDPFLPALALSAAITLIGALPAFRRLTSTLGDTDDAMRLVQVRALLAGRPWWDLIEPRLAPPHGLLVHWSRLLDGAIAAVMWLCQTILGSGAGELAARALWPLLLYTPMAFALLRASRRLGGEAALWCAAAITPLCVVVVNQFEPGRLDHDNVQLTLLAWTLLLALSAERVRSAALMGALSALSLAIGFESILVVAWAGALIVTRYVALDDGAKPAIAFGLTLAGALLTLFVIQTPPQLWLHMTCDALGANMVAGAGVGGLALAGAGHFARGSGRTRTLAAAGAGMAGIGLFLVLHPVCIHGPYAELEPRVIAVWLDRVGEAMPLWDWLKQRPLEALEVAPFPLAALTAALAAIVRGRRDGQFLAAASLLAMCAVVAVIEIRGFVLATAAAIPVAAGLAGRIKRVDFISPLAGGVTLAIVFSPFATACLLQLAAPAALRTQAKAAAIDQTACLKIAAMDDLKKLPPGLVLADLDVGPNILALTRHTAVGAPYHRLGPQIYDLMTVFDAPLNRAALVVEREHADYVALCRTGVARADNVSGSFGAALLAGAPPPWLAPLGSADGAFAIFRVRKDELAAYDGLRGPEMSALATAALPAP